MSEEDPSPSDSIQEKRVYSDTAGKTELYVAADLGIAAVHVAADRVGEFGVTRRCSPRDIAASADRVAVATQEDVLVTDPAESSSFVSIGFGPAVAVGFTPEDDVLAAAPDGRLARLADPRSDHWRECGTVGGSVTAIDRGFVAASDGVYRVIGDDLTNVGLSDVRDVAATGVPLAATATGLYQLGNGWMDVLSGDFGVVETRAIEAATDRPRVDAHAASSDTLYERLTNDWRPVDLPTDTSIAGIAYADDSTYVIAVDGTLLLDAGDGDAWREHVLGLRDVVGLVIR